jgi:hypothetical protein
MPGCRWKSPVPPQLIRSRRWTSSYSPSSRPDAWGSHG